MSPPLIRQVLETLSGRALFSSQLYVLIDSPPGVSCSAVSAVMESDVIALVTEPTSFGQFDLRLACKAFAPLNKSMGAVINRAGLRNDDIYHFCEKVQLPILVEIPYQRGIAKTYSKGLVVVQSSEKMNI